MLMSSRTAIIAILSATLSACNPSTDAPSKNSLTVVSFGGPYQEAQRTAYMIPFSKKYGIALTEGEYNGEYGLISQRARATSGSWDVVSVESGPALRGGAEGLFKPIPEGLLDGLNIAPAARRKFSVGHLSFATILAYPEALGKQAPSSWIDFFDLKKYPGRRGLRNNPRGTLEIALLADGVAPDKLYPLDVERALHKLETIRSSIVFWDSGAQPTQLLANNSVAMTSAFNGRIWSAKTKDKLPVGWTFKSGLYEYEYWAVPKNAPHPDLAFRFIRFSLEKDAQADFANQIAYLPTNLDAMPLISPNVRSAMPGGSDKQDEVIVDAEWWAQNEGQVGARWERWMAGH
ncbi:MAG: ABC transporter substrate-binding protein [Pseudomonadota bacterium]|nr:ABC transporter substrate-binding protein [Pseudomonadota bacterium]